MRHEKISLADHIILPDALAEAEEKGAKGPPVTIQHFFYCGRTPSRSRSISGQAGAKGKSPNV